MSRHSSYRKGLSTRIYAVIAVVVVAAAAIGVYVTMGRITPSAPVKIVFAGWVSSGAEYQFDQNMVNLFNSQHKDVQVVFEPITSDYNTKLKTEIAAGDAPDVFYLDSSEAYTYIKNGLLLPLNSFVSSNSTYNISDFIPETIQAFEYNGNIYAIPKDWSPLGLFYTGAHWASSTIQPTSNRQESPLHPGLGRNSTRTQLSSQ